MKKTLLSIMVAAISLFTFYVMAQGKKCEKKDCSQETCDKPIQCEKKVKPDCPNPFVGIELTKEQQEKLDALKSSCPIKDKKKGDRKRYRQYRDSIARDAQVKHLAEVKKILTPEQYVQFLENMVLDSQKKAPKHKKHNRKGMRKADNCPMPKDCQKRKK